MSRLKFSLPIYWLGPCIGVTYPRKQTVKSAARIKERGNRAWEYWMLFPILCGGNETYEFVSSKRRFCLSFVLALMNASITIKHLCIPLKAPISKVVITGTKARSRRRSRRSGRSGMCLHLGRYCERTRCRKSRMGLYMGRFCGPADQ
jgi:hypothetical protein